MFPHVSFQACFMLLCLLFLSSSLLVQVSAQSSSATTTTAVSSTLSANVTVVPTTSSYTTTIVSRSGNQNIPLTTVVPTAFNATKTISAAASATSSASPTPTPIVLDTKLNPAFGVLGAILILTGLPSAFWGHKNRWQVHLDTLIHRLDSHFAHRTSFFLIGFYTLSLVCFVLILKFGVLSAINPPNNTLQGMFVLASVVAGIMGGGITIFFWKASKYFIGAWGGFAFGLWIQCFKDGGVIASIGLRWILYIACGVVGFVLCTIPKLHWHVLLVATAVVGSSAFILGIDCYTSAGLKEFYIWNLGFTDLFPKYTSNGIAFPVTQTMEIELGLMAAIALMGGAVQLRILRILQHKLKEISMEQKKRDEEAELEASSRFADLSKEQDEWEREHPSLGRHGRYGSGYSGIPLMKEFPSMNDSNEGRSSTLTLTGDRRARHQSGISEFMAAPIPDEEARHAARHSQNPGALPTLDLGLGIEEDVPSSFITEGFNNVKKTGTASDPELQRKEELLAEIQTIRRSIDLLRSETPGNSSDDSRSRHVSLTSRRTLSYDLDNAIMPRIPHSRPPRQPDPRNRAQSMELDTMINSPPLGASIGRPTSAPLRDEDWDSYVRDRKLLQPPSGISAPIPTTAIKPSLSAGTSAARLPVPQAVTEALVQRKRRESLLDPDVTGNDAAVKDVSSDDIPIAALSPPPRAYTRRPKQPRPTSVSPVAAAPVNNVPIILPRKNIVSPTPQRPEVQRVATYEELEERHREKMKTLQSPLTQAAKEQAKIDAAKQRWERSKAVEKELVTKRHAEKSAQIARDERTKRKSEDELGKRGSTVLEPNKSGDRQSRNLTPDKLAQIGGSSSKRQSVMRVEDWQRNQQDAELGVKPERAGGTTSKRDSRVVKGDAAPAVPFPGQNRSRDAAPDRRRSSGFPRDPPS
ncbi:hypothetical protein SERLA73DRAFT_82731 [Serpula lacrymans var. lacrymans S7.3]|uniref:TM7S3/TM198-like domain-containing protein n=2 Tax=Serpula lacrymans var. lacrymans TaxID=341189 RepID=F8PIG5_SERL3|nr:uncharacterized protein SERLADRAFT_412457 [Serpula lacrymans var. lacrymans S7.9]EGO05208.1 hypothetical protein SERLA73DRAFT_82731 [Serpula lacrymans var. lacrymans S7.3]EGO30948.1 hypothetical protein SERLADRAFT_412457 [Serpula lacrymans var. lacrymans S7.9]